MFALVKPERVGPGQPSTPVSDLEAHVVPTCVAREACLGQQLAVDEPLAPASGLQTRFTLLTQAVRPGSNARAKWRPAERGDAPGWRRFNYQRVVLHADG